MPPSAEDEAKDLAKAGIPTDAKGLSNLGAKEGLLSAEAALRRGKARRDRKGDSVAIFAHYPLHFNRL